MIRFTIMMGLVALGIPMAYRMRKSAVCSLNALISGVCLLGIMSI